MDLVNLMAGIADGSLDRIKKADPEKHREMIELTLSLFEIGLMLIKVSPEIRRAFAEIHGEFLKYPECRETIVQAYKAKNEFVPDVT